MFFTADLDRWISNLQYLLKRLLLFTGSVKAWVSTTLCPLSGHFQEVDDLLDLNPPPLCVVMVSSWAKYLLLYVIFFLNLIFSYFFPAPS